MVGIWDHHPDSYTGPTVGLNLVSALVLES